MTTPDPRLVTDRNIWLATTRPDGRPHLAPVWFVWLRDRAFICTPSKSVKGRNLAANPRVSFALENGDKGLVCEGAATRLPLPHPPDVLAAFKEKYNWDIPTDPEYDALIEITPIKWPQIGV